MSVTVIPKKTVTIIEPKKSLLVDKEKYRQKRVAAYCRVSTGSEEQLTSYKTQMKVYTDMIASNKDWELAGIFADEGISGTRADKRPQFKKMISDCLNGKIDMIITKSVSRFARNTVECLEFVRMLKARGIGVFFEEQNIDTLKADSELYLVIYAGFAQSESESMSKNITWAYRKNFENGIGNFFTNKLLGYKRGENGEPEIVPEEAEVVKEIFNRYIGGETLQQIADLIESRHYTFKNKKFTFSRSFIRSILRNEKYAGDMILQKTISVDCITKTRKRNQGEAPMYLVQNHHVPIVSREVFNKAQEEIARRNTIAPKSQKETVSHTGKYSKYALSDVLKCGECGSRFRRCTWMRSGYNKIVWRCINRLENGTDFCPDSISIEEKDLHEAIVRALVRFSDEDSYTYLALMKATISDALGLSGSSDEADLLQRQIDALNKQMLDLVNQCAKNGEGFDAYEETFREINDHINQLKSRINAIQQNQSSDKEYKKKLDMIEQIINERKASTNSYDDTIVRQMVECIKVFHDGRIEVYFGGGTMIEEHV